MKKQIKRFEDLCPECGHLLPKKIWNCNFCGWSLQAFGRDDSELYSWNDYSDFDQLSNIDKDIKRLIEDS